VEPNHQRNAYRIKYPREERPVLDIGERALSVIDCSETGLRFEVVAGATPPRIGMSLRGRVRFADGTEVDVEGDVTRIEARYAALRFTAAVVPYAVILAEQKRLRRVFLEPKDRAD